MAWARASSSRNYDWKNPFGRQPWAKMVRAEFKEANSRMFGFREVGAKKQVEVEAVREFATEAWIRKEFHRVVQLVAEDQQVTFTPPDPLIDQQLTAITAQVAGVDLDEPAAVMDEAEFIQANRKAIIPRTLGTLFHVFVQENMWAIVKKHKYPDISFKKLKAHLINRIKAVLKELF